LVVGRAGPAIDNLIARFHKRQEGQVSRPLDLTGQFTLAPRTIARLATRLDLADVGQVTAQGIRVTIIEAPAIRAISTPASASVAARGPPVPP